MKTEYIEMVNEADLVLVGIGKEFEKNRYQCHENAIEALRELHNLLIGKNYYLISTCINDILEKSGFEQERIVTPCGNLHMKQCVNQCEGSLQRLLPEELQQIQNYSEKNNDFQLGVCQVCGKSLVLNNVYAENYDEKGYLESWKYYTKWLQGTLNKKLCILELGVDLSFPTIIRWPFEKVAYYNQKAKMIRVNERLYQMSEELKEKGISINQNSIDWLLDK